MRAGGLGGLHLHHGALDIRQRHNDAAFIADELGLLANDLNQAAAAIGSEVGMREDWKGHGSLSRLESVQSCTWAISTRPPRTPSPNSKHAQMTRCGGRGFTNVCSMQGCSTAPRPNVRRSGRFSFRTPGFQTGSMETGNWSSCLRGSVQKGLLKALLSLIKRLVSTMSSFSAFRCHFSRGKLAGGPWFGAVFHRAILAGCLRCSGLQKNMGD